MKQPPTKAYLKPTALLKYAALLAPFVTGAVAIATYLKERIIYTLLGIMIPPQINEFSVVSISAIAIGVLTLVAVLTAYTMLENNRKRRRLAMTFYVIFFGPLITLPFFLNGLPLIANIVYAVSIVVLTTLLPIALASLLRREDTFRLFQGDTVTLMLKSVGLSVLIVFAFAWVAVGHRVLVFVATPDNHNIVHYKSDDYVIITKHDRNFLLSRLCTDGRVAYGSYRFTLVQDTAPTDLRHFALDPHRCAY